MLEYALTLYYLNGLNYFQLLSMPLVMTVNSLTYLPPLTASLSSPQTLRYKMLFLTRILLILNPWLGGH